MQQGNSKEYLLLADRRFGKQAMKELVGMFPKAEVLESWTYDCLSTVTARIATRNSKSLLSSSRPVFIDFMTPVDVRLGKFGGDYDKVTKAIAQAMSRQKGKRFKLEVKKIGAKLDMNAKAIEVLLGRAMEKLGFKADLERPEIIVYVVFLKGRVVIGHADARNGALDTIRLENKCKENGTVNRAEFKIKEAVEFFGIDLKKVGTCLDIGAAPGGWTHYLSQHRIRVVAVDGALLNYGALAKDKTLLIITKKGETNAIKKQISKYRNVKVGATHDKRKLHRYDIIHLKANVLRGKTLEMIDLMDKFGMLTIDTNTSPKESAEIANSMSRFLKRGATLVMTVKLVTKSVNSHIASVNEKLSKCYGHIIMKKLPHNREELTVCAIRK